LHAVFWDTYAKELGVRIIAPDRPGFGLSEFDPDRTLLDWPDTLVELADHLLLKKFSVIGISGGGPYAAVTAYKIPKRLNRVGIVVGLAPTYEKGVLEGLSWWPKFQWSHYGVSKFYRVGASVGYNVLNTVLPTTDLYMRLFGSSADKKYFTDPLARKRFGAITREAFRIGFKGPAHDLYLYSHDWGFDLAKIIPHVYLWYGSDDRNVPIATGKFFATHIPKNTYTVYPNEGHMIMRTHTREILQSLMK